MPQNDELPSNWNWKSWKIAIFGILPFRTGATTYNQPNTLTGAIVLTSTGLKELGVFRIYIGWVYVNIRLRICMGIGISRYMSYAWGWFFFCFFLLILTFGFFWWGVYL